MKKALLLICGIIIFSLSGCRNFNADSNNGENISLQKSVKNHEENVSWTRELEKGRLTQKIDSNDFVKNSLKLNPQTMIALEASKSKFPVYPEVEGFASLDISDLDSEVVEKINLFFLSYLKQKPCDSFMEENSIYSLVLFNYDFGKLNFTKSLTDWYIGKPFLLENMLEVPVRIFDKEKICDVKFYFKLNNTKEEINAEAIDKKIEQKKEEEKKEKPQESKDEAAKEKKDDKKENKTDGKKSEKNEIRDEWKIMDLQIEKIIWEGENGKQ